MLICFTEYTRIDAPFSHEGEHEELDDDEWRAMPVYELQLPPSYHILQSYPAILHNTMPYYAVISSSWQTHPSLYRL